MTSETADVVVIGGGLAGMIAANGCAERGLRVLVLEQGAEERYLCNSRITMGIMQIALNDLGSGAENLRRAIDNATRGYVDSALADSYAREAGPALRWLLDQGVRVIRGGAVTNNLTVLAPPTPRRPGLHWEGRGGDVTLRLLTAKLQERGGALRRNTRARELVMKDGCCVGVKASSGDETILFNARAVVIADGGFQANDDLVRRYISPRPDRLLQRNAKTGKGDGLLMAQAIGAKLSDMECFYGHVQSRDAMSNPMLWPYPTVDYPLAAGMVVGADGKRFADEGLAGVAVANAIARLDDPLSAVAIFDQAIWEAAGKTYLMSANPFLPEEGGTLHRSDTIAGLAALAGLPAEALAATVAAFNAACDTGGFGALTPPRTTDLAHPWGSPPMPIRHRPYYAVPLCTGITYTMGGLAIDPEARVLHEGGAAIQGLYAAGASIGGLEGGPLTGYTGGLAKAITWGRRAALTITAAQPR